VKTSFGETTFYYGIRGVESRFFLVNEPILPICELTKLTICSGAACYFYPSSIFMALQKALAAWCSWATT